MTSTESRRRAQEVRDRYRAELLERMARESRQQTVLDPPEFAPGTIVDTTDGTLNKDVLVDDLVVDMVAWTDLPPTAEDTSLAFVEWARVEGADPPADHEYKRVDTKSVTGPDADTQFPLKLKVPKARLGPDGKYYLRLAMEHYNGSPAIHSVPLPLICDSGPPYRHEAPLAVVAPSDSITDEYLSDNDDKVICGIPQYSDYQSGDRVAYYWGAFPPPDVPEDEVPVDVIMVDGTNWPFPVEFPGSTIRAAGDGRCYALYALIDKATNISRLSIYVGFNVALGPLPTNLKDPEVPLAADGLLDLKDAIMGVDVQIPLFDNHKPSDFLNVTWGGIPLQGVPIGAGTFPVSIRVPSLTLLTAYGTGPAPVATEVTYKVTRGGLDSEVRRISVMVDFSYIGPPRPDPDPDWPDPVNPDLLPLSVYGEVSQTLNVLTRNDEGKDAIIKFKLYAPLEEGHVVSFYWKNVVVPEAEYTVLAADKPGDEKSATVPWSYILDAFNDPELPVHYRIRESEDASNEQHSTDTKVNADAVTLKAPDPAFEGLFNNKYLNCNSLSDPANPSPLDPAVRVRVPDLANSPFALKVGDKISMKWVLLSGVTGETPIDTAELVEEITLNDSNYPPTGFIWRVQPYATHLLPAYDPGGAGADGRGRASYSFIFNTERIFSVEKEAVVSMHTGVGSCPITP